MIVIVDYGMGNLRSVEKAFEACGARVRVTSSKKEIERAGKVVLPGVGAFTAAMKELKRLGLADVLRKKILDGTPYLGFCLGLQLLFDESEEGAAVKKTKGLSIVPGKVKRFPKGLKVPHMGWNTLKLKKKDCPLWKGVGPEDYFYFAHSYYGAPKNAEWVSSETEYGVNFCSALWRDNIFATQFHPEKSQKAGLRIIRNFIRLE